MRWLRLARATSDARLPQPYDCQLPGIAMNSTSGQKGPVATPAWLAASGCEQPVAPPMLSDCCWAVRAVEIRQAIAQASCQIEDLKPIQAEHIERSTMSGSLALGLGLLTAGASISKAQQTGPRRSAETDAVTYGAPEALACSERCRRRCRNWHPGPCSGAVDGR